MTDSPQAADSSTVRSFAAQLDRLLGALLTRAVRSMTSPYLSQDGELACALCDRSGRTILERGGHPVLVGALGAQVRALLADTATRVALQADAVVLSNSAPRLPDATMAEIEVTAATPAQAALDRRSFTLLVALPGGERPAEFYLALCARFPRAPFGVPSDRGAFFQPGDEPADASDLAALPPAVGPRYLPFAAARPAAPPRTADDEGSELPAVVFSESRAADLGRRAGLQRGEQNDLIGLRAALLHGKRALISLLGRTPNASACAADLQAGAAAQIAALLDELPAGFYAFADSLDDDGCGATDIPLRATLLLQRRGAGMAMSLDLSDSAEAVAGPLNLPAGATTAVLKEVLFRLAWARSAQRTQGAPWLPRNDGLLSAVCLRLRRGSLLAAESPYALGLGIDETAQRLFDVLCGAFAQVVPALVGSAGGGTRSALFLSPPDGAQPRGGSSGSPIDQRLCLPAGHGAAANPRAVRGALLLDDLGSLEAQEARAPVRIVTLAQRGDSGGMGLRSGGPGWQRELTLLRPAVVTLAGERRRRPPYGLAGGGPGVPGRDRLQRGEAQHTLPEKVVLEGQIGDGIVSESPGGAGHGDAQRAAFFASLFGESS